MPLLRVAIFWWFHRETPPGNRWFGVSRPKNERPVFQDRRPFRAREPRPTRDSAPAGRGARGRASATARRRRTRTDSQRIRSKGHGMSRGLSNHFCDIFFLNGVPGVYPTTSVMQGNIPFFMGAFVFGVRPFVKYYRFPTAPIQLHL